MNKLFTKKVKKLIIISICRAKQGKKKRNNLYKYKNKLRNHIKIFNKMSIICLHHIKIYKKIKIYNLQGMKYFKMI